LPCTEVSEEGGKGDNAHILQLNIRVFVNVRLKGFKQLAIQARNAIFAHKLKRMRIPGYMVLILALVLTLPSHGQQILKDAGKINPLMGDVRSIIVNHPDTSAIIAPGVGDNWPMGKRDTAKWNAVLKTGVALSCDNMRNFMAVKALEYLGVLYRYGQSSEKGFDCSGYVMYIYRLFGLSLPHDAVAQYFMSRHINKSEAQPGDLVFFRTIGKQISHVGIYLGNNVFVHSPGKGRSVTTESLDFPYYKSRFAGFGSIL
jgi:hypothetical protein